MGTAKFFNKNCDCPSKNMDRLDVREDLYTFYVWEYGLILSDPGELKWVPEVLMEETTAHNVLDQIKLKADAPDKNMRKTDTPPFSDHPSKTLKVTDSSSAASNIVLGFSGKIVPRLFPQPTTAREMCKLFPLLEVV